MIRLALRVRRADAELVLAELLELVPSGVEEVDAGEQVEYAIYGAPGELPELPELRARAGDALVAVSTSELADDWSERWKGFHTPLELPGLSVRPPWTPAVSPSDCAEVVIDPGQAFGTGSHATTRLCLELLLELDPYGGVLDVGCGSGVLAIAAVKLGFSPVTALDNDSASVEATIANAAANGVELEATGADLRRDPLPPAPTLLANLVRPLLLALAQRIARPFPTTLIACGLLDHEADEIAATFADRGLAERERRSLSGWTALWLTRES